MNTTVPVHPGHVLSQHCRDCEYAPGDGKGSHVALRAMRNFYAELATAHTMENRGHRVVTLVDDVEKSIHVFQDAGAGAKLECDQCRRRFPKSLALRWEDLTFCPDCGDNS